MKKVEKLTPEQEAKIPEYLEKYYNKIYNPQKVDEKKAIKSINYIYKEAGYGEPQVIFATSPIDAQIIANTFTQEDKIKNIVDNMRKNKVPVTEMFEKLRGKIKYEETSWYGNISDYGWTCFYEFINNEIFPDFKLEIWDIWKELVESNIYDMIQLEKVCIVIVMPEHVKVNADKRLHCETGSAIRWSDGYELYYLNGINVPDYIVNLPADELDPHLILNEQNADIQREIIKKIGAEKILKKLDAVVLDKWTDGKTGKYYELLNLKVGNIDRKYLYYEHASIPGYFYAKPVPPETKTARDGRAWILSLVDRGELAEITLQKGIAIEANLPEQLS